jgi:small subunit ribosomal protein S20
MPITKSAKKSLRVSRTKKAQNKKSKVSLSKALKASNAKNIGDTFSVIDKAAKTGIIHKNKAARLKSQISKKFKEEKASKKTVAKVVEKAKPEIKKTAAKVKESVKKVTPKKTATKKK